MCRGLASLILLGSYALSGCASRDNDHAAKEAPLSLAEDCTGDGPCVYSEEFDCDAKDFFRGPWDFNGTTAYGECYAPPGLLPHVEQDSCARDSDCRHGSFCEDGRCQSVHNYFCANPVNEPTAFGCNSGVSPACSTEEQTCLDQWFECLPATPEFRLAWPALGDRCEDIILTYEIVAEQYDETASTAFCSKRHEGCAASDNCANGQRPAADHCGPTQPELDAASHDYDCLTGDFPVLGCPDSSSTDWPPGLRASRDFEFVRRAEEKVGEVCEAAGCSSIAVCRPGDGTFGYTDGDLGIQGSSGIKDDSFIGHARVCTGSGVEICNDASRTGTTDAHACLEGNANDDSRDALVPGGVSRREIDIRCQCVYGS